MLKHLISMASIKKTVDKIVHSEEFKDAVEEFRLKDIEFILIDLCHLVYERTKTKCLKTYGSYKRCNELMIKAKLNAVPPPEDLYFNIR